MNLRRKIEEEEMTFTEGFCLGLEGTGRMKQGQSHGVDSLMSGNRLRGAGKEEEEQAGDAQQHREQERLCRDGQVIAKFRILFLIIAHQSDIL